MGGIGVGSFDMYCFFFIFEYRQLNMSFGRLIYFVQTLIP